MEKVGCQIGCRFQDIQFTKIYLQGLIATLPFGGTLCPGRIAVPVSPWLSDPLF